MTYVRMLALLALSGVTAFLIPPLPDNHLLSILETQILNAGLLYTIILGFLLYMSMTRKTGVEEAISLELNKTRRLYHLALHLYRAEPRLKAWFQLVKKGLENYHAFFRKRSFDQYESSDPLFRTVTYTIYSLPSLGIPYDAALYGALLDTAGSATEARELINDKQNASLGRFAWVVMLVITVVFCGLVLLATPNEPIACVISTLVNFSLLLALHLLYEYDRANILRRRYIAELYTANIHKAEHTDRAR